MIPTLGRELLARDFGIYRAEGEVKEGARVGRTTIRSLEIQEAEKLLDRIPQGLGLCSLAEHGKSTRLGFLAGLLSNEWLAERRIDTLVSYLDGRLRKGNQPGATLVATSTSGHRRRKSEVKPQQSCKGIDNSERMLKGFWVVVSNVSFSPITSGVPSPITGSHPPSIVTTPRVESISR